MSSRSRAREACRRRRWACLISWSAEAVLLRALMYLDEIGMNDFAGGETAWMFVFGAEDWLWIGFVVDLIFGLAFGLEMRTAFPVTLIGEGGSIATVIWL